MLLLLSAGLGGCQDPPPRVVAAAPDMSGGDGGGDLGPGADQGVACAVPCDGACVQGACVEFEGAIVWVGGEVAPNDLGLAGRGTFSAPARVDEPGIQFEGRVR